MLNPASYRVCVTFDEMGQLGNTMSFHTIEPGKTFKRKSSALVATNSPKTVIVYVKKQNKQLIVIGTFESHKSVILAPIHKIDLFNI